MSVINISDSSTTFWGIKKRFSNVDLSTAQFNKRRGLCVVCWSFWNFSVANIVDPD